MKLGEGNFGPEAKFDVEFVDGKLQLKVTYDGLEADAYLVLKLDPSSLLDKLAAAIPGEVDDAILAAFKGAFLK